MSIKCAEQQFYLYFHANFLVKTCLGNIKRVDLQYEIKNLLSVADLHSAQVVTTVVIVTCDDYVVNCFQMCIFAQAETTSRIREAADNEL